MTVRRKRAISLRSVGLLLSLSLTLPNPAWALPTQSPDEVAETHSGLEEKLSDSNRQPGRSYHVEMPADVSAPAVLRFLQEESWWGQPVRRGERQVEVQYPWAIPLPGPAREPDSGTGLGPVERTQAGLEESWVILEPGHAEYDRIFAAGREMLDIFAGEELIGYLSSLPEGVGVVFRVMPRSAAEAEELEGGWGLSPLRSGWDLVFRLKGHPVLPKLLLEREGEPGEGAEVLEFTLNGGDVLRVVSPDSATFEGSASLPAGFKEEVSRYRSGALKGPEDLRWVGKVVQYLEQGRLQIRRLEGVAYGLPGEASAKGRFIEQTGLPAERVLTEGELEERRREHAARMAAERRTDFERRLLVDPEFTGLLQRIKGLREELDQRAGEPFPPDRKEIRLLRERIDQVVLEGIVRREVTRGGEYEEIHGRVLKGLESEEQEIRRGIGALGRRGMGAGAPASFAAWGAVLAGGEVTPEMNLSQYVELAQERIGAADWKGLVPLVGMLPSIGAPAIYARPGGSETAALDSLDRLVRRIHALPDGDWPAAPEEQEALSGLYSSALTLLVLSRRISRSTASVAAEDDWGLNEVWQVLSRLLRDPRFWTGAPGRLGFDRLAAKFPQVDRPGDKARELWGDALRVLLLPALWASFRASEMDRANWPEFMASFDVILKGMSHYAGKLKVVPEKADGPEDYPGFRRKLERVDFEIGQHRELQRDFLLRKEYAAVNLSGVLLAFGAWLIESLGEPEIAASFRKGAEGRYDLAQGIEPAAPVWRAQFAGLEEDGVILEPGHAEYGRLFPADRSLLEILTGQELADYLGSLPEGTGAVLRVLPRNPDEAKELEQDWRLSPLSHGWGLVRELKAKPVLPKSLPALEEGKDSSAEVLEFTLDSGDVLRVVPPDSVTFGGSQVLPAGFKGEASRYHAGRMKKDEGLKWVGKVVQYLEQGLLEIRLEGVLYGLPGEASAKEKFLKETGLPAARVLTEDEFEQRRSARASQAAEERRVKMTAQLLQDGDLKDRLRRIKGLVSDLEQRIDELVRADSRQVRQIRESIHMASLESVVSHEVALSGDLPAVRGRIVQRLEREEGLIRAAISSLAERGGPVAQFLQRLTPALAAEGWGEAVAVLKDFEDLSKRVMEGTAEVTEREWEKLRGMLRALVTKMGDSPIGVGGDSAVVESAVSVAALLLTLWRQMKTEEVDLLLGPKFEDGSTLWLWMDTFVWNPGRSGSVKGVWELAALRGSKAEARLVWREALDLLQEATAPGAGGSPLLGEALPGVEEDQVGDLARQLFEEMGSIPGALPRGLLLRQEAAILNLYAVVQELRAQASQRMGRKQQAVQLAQDAERFYGLAAGTKPSAFAPWRPSFKQPISIPRSELERYLRVVEELLDTRQWARFVPMAGELPRVQARAMWQNRGAVELEALQLEDELVRRIQAIPAEQLPADAGQRSAIEVWYTSAAALLIFSDRLSPEAASGIVRQGWKVTDRVLALVGQVVMDPRISKRANLIGLRQLGVKYPELVEEGQPEWGVWQEALVALVLSATNSAHREMIEAVLGPQAAAPMPPRVVRIAEQLIEQRDLQRDFLLRKEAAAVNLAAVSSEIRAILSEEKGDLAYAQRMHEQARLRYELISTKIDPSYPVWRPGQAAGPSAELGAGLEERQGLVSAVREQAIPGRKIAVLLEQQLVQPPDPSYDLFDTEVALIGLSGILHRQWRLPDDFDLRVGLLTEENLQTYGTEFERVLVRRSPEDARAGNSVRWAALPLLIADGLRHGPGTLTAEVARYDVGAMTLEQILRSFESLFSA